MKKQLISAAIAVIMTAVVYAPTTVSADEWVQTDAGYVYEYDNGTTAEKGWLTIDGNNYYIQNDGTRKTGWLKTTSGSKYYFDKDGIMQKSRWLNMKSGDKYYLRKDGKAAINCSLKINGEVYSFDEDGKLIVKSKEISLGMTVEDLKNSIDLSEYVSSDDGSLFLTESKISTLSGYYIYFITNNKLSQYGYAVNNEKGNLNKLKKYYEKSFGSSPDYSGQNGCYWKLKSSYFCIYISDDYIFATYSKNQLVQKNTTSNTTSNSSKSRTVYVTKTGKKYHYSNSCNGGTYYASTLEAARSRGLTACDKCVN